MEETNSKTYPKRRHWVPQHGKTGIASGMKNKSVRDWRDDSSWNSIIFILCAASLLAAILANLLNTLWGQVSNETIIRFREALAPIFLAEQFASGLSSGYMGEAASEGVGMLAATLLMASVLSAAVLFLRFLIYRMFEMRMKVVPENQVQSDKLPSQPLDADSITNTAADINWGPDAGPKRWAPENQSNPVSVMKSSAVESSAVESSTVEPSALQFFAIESSMAVDSGPDTALYAQKSREVGNMAEPDNHQEAESLPDIRTGRRSEKPEMRPVPRNKVSKAVTDSADAMAELLFKRREAETPMKPENYEPGFKNSDVTGLVDEAKAAALKRLAELQKFMEPVRYNRSYVRFQIFGEDGRVVTDEIRSPNEAGTIQYPLMLYGSNVQTIEIRMTGRECRVFYSSNNNEAAYQTLTRNQPEPFTFRQSGSGVEPVCVITWFGGGGND